MAATGGSHAFVSLLILFFVGCDAFLPNKLNGFLGGGGNDDYTHQDITEQGILRVVAKIFEATPRDGKTIPPGSLTGLNPLTPEGLFDKYYGGGVSVAKHKTAIDDIVKANNKVDLEQGDSAKHHFYGEQIKEGNSVLQNLRDNLIKLLKADNSDYDAAREMVGKYLHTLQMFYSNTNWVELKGDTAYRDLGITGKPLMAVATPDTPTCKNCETSPLGVRDPCDNNIILTGDILTSGYRSGIDVAKPVGGAAKCSHGGVPDVSRYFPATGGINKDTSDPNLSPHNKLHKEAGRAAIRATELFFDNEVDGTGLRQLVGDDQVKDLFNLGSGNSMVFVIDISGSMSNDIAAVKSVTKKIINDTAGSANAPFNYVLSTFSDPDTIGEVKVTKDPIEFYNWISALTVNGGGDCPEYAMLGIERAVKVALPGSKVYIFTDADPKDPERFNAVLSVVQAKKITLEFLLTGKCTALRNRRNIRTKGGNGGQSKRFTKRKRSDTTDFYKLLAEKSGGEVIKTDKENIGDVIDTIKTGTLDCTVALMKFKLQPNASVDFFIDDTITAFSIQVNGDTKSKPKISITNPEGSTMTVGVEATATVDSYGIKVIQIDNPKPGKWILFSKDTSKFDVELNGATPFTFKYQFIEEKTSGSWYPIVGNPIVGKPTTMTIQTTGNSHIGSLTQVRFVEAATGHIVAEYPLTAGSGKTEGYYKAVVNLKAGDTRVRVVGEDWSNHTVVRTILSPLEPDTTKLELNNVKGELRPGTSVFLSFNVINYGGVRTLKLKVGNDKGFIVHVEPSTFNLKTGQIARGKITVFAPETAASLMTVALTVTVTGEDNALYNSIIQRVFVTEALENTTILYTSKTSVATAKSSSEITSEKSRHTTSKSEVVGHTTSTTTNTLTPKVITKIEIIFPEQGLTTWKTIAIVAGVTIGVLIIALAATFMIKKLERRGRTNPLRNRRTLSQMSMVSTGKIPY